MTQVYLNVYELTSFDPYNGYLIRLGFGAFHSGVEVYGKEYSYGYNNTYTTGIFDIEPKSACGCKYRESLYIGDTYYSLEQVEGIIESMEEDFMGYDYDIYSKNCNHFTRELCLKLTGNSIPYYLNRLAFVGSLFRCLIPLDSNGNRIDSNNNNSNSNRLNIQSNDIIEVNDDDDDDDDDEFTKFLINPSLSIQK